MIRRLLLTALAIITVAAAREPAAAYLLFGPAWNSMPDETHLEHLQAAGFQVDVVDAATLDWERLRQYNVVVVYDMPQPTDGKWSAKYPEVPALLERFVKAGGGLLSVGLCASHGQNTVHNELLRPFAIQAPYERFYEGDPGKVYTMTSMFGHRFILTTNIAGGHPVTEGVRSLWTYSPRDGATLGEYPHPLVPGDDAWTVLVRGAVTCRSIRMPNFAELTDETAEPATTYAAAPPLVAARDFGKGRLVVSVVNQSHLLFNGWHFAYDGVAMAKGDGVTPSHWERLFVNACHWLAEPSLAGDELGGFVATTDATQAAAAALAEAHKVGFARTEFGPPTGTHWKGLIGARTAYSCGSGSVADYSAAARAAGYAWIVFTERYEDLTEDEWDRLVADCAAATSLTGTADDFWAIPGLDYADQCGNRFVAFGPDMGWLKPEWRQTKRFGCNEDMAVNYRFPDTILFELDKNTLDPHYLGQYYSIAIETYRGADQQVTSNELPTYARMQYLRYNLHPTALHFVDAPAQVATAATTGFQNCIRLEKLGDALERISGHESRYSHVNHPLPIYVSEGPRITAWQGSHTAIGSRDRFLDGEGIQHWEARLAVAADAPLTEVRFSNGPYLLRRLVPETANWDYVFHGFHDRQYNLFATVQDAAGRRAVTSCLIVLELRNSLVNCTDNRNIILGGCYGHSRKPPRGFEMYFRSPYLGVLGAGTPLFHGVEETLQQLNPIDDRTEYFTSKDIVILDDPIKATWPVGLIAHGAKANGYPNADDLPIEDYALDRRTYRLTTGKDNPELLAVDFAITFKRQLHFPEKPGRDLTVARLGATPSVPADSQAIVVGDADRMTIHKRINGKVAVVDTLEPGQYLAIAPYLTGAAAILPLDQPLQFYAVVQDGSPTVFAGIDLPPVVNPGDRFTARYLYAVGDFGEPVDSPQFAAIVRQLGLAGAPEYTVTPDTGKVADTKLFLTVDTDNGAFSGTISRAPLPVDGLTLCLRGVNPNWSAGLYGRDNDILSRIGGRDGTAWANIDISTDRDLFAGNLLTCDAPDLILVYLADGAWQAHNPTTEPITATVKSQPRFTRIAPFTREVTVPPGQTLNFTN